MSEFACSLSAGKSDDGSQLGIGKPLIVGPSVHYSFVRAQIKKNAFELKFLLPLSSTEHPPP